MTSVLMVGKLAKRPLTKEPLSYQITLFKNMQHLQLIKIKGLALAGVDQWLECRMAH